MKALVVCSKPPLPAVDGGCLASHRLIMDLQLAGCEVRVVSMATAKHPYQAEKVDEDFKSSTDFEAVEVNASLNPLNVLLNLFERRSIQERRFYHKHFEACISAKVDQFRPDFIVFDELRSAVYMKAFMGKGMKCVYRSHNLEFDLFKQRSTAAGNALSALYLRMQSVRLMAFEKSIWEQADNVWSISPIDLKKATEWNWATGSASVHPFSIETRENVQEIPPWVFHHLGSMDWAPNIEGIDWLCKAWPEVRNAHTNAELHLGGRGIHRFSQQWKAEGVFIYEEVKDADTFKQKYGSLIVPLFTGSGTRIKILQAMARGNLVISTEKGLEGLGVKDGEEVLVFKDEIELKEVIGRVISEKNLKAHIIERAMKYIAEKHDPERNAMELIKSLD